MHHIWNLDHLLNFVMKCEIALFPSTIMKVWRKNCFNYIFFIITLISIRFVIMFYWKLFPSGVPLLKPYSSCASGKVQTDTLNKLLALARHIIKAHRYSRNFQTISELNEAYSIAQTLLYKANDANCVETVNVWKTNNADSKHLALDANQPDVCPEIYAGMKYGYSGYQTDYKNCKGKHMASVLTILVNSIVHNVSANNLDAILTSLQMYYPNVMVMVALSLDNDDVVYRFASYNNFLPVTIENPIMSTGSVWRLLAEKASTKYVFIARQVLQLDNHTNFERLLRFVSYGIADAVGTSHRYMDGRWFRGCHTTAIRNYTMKFLDGYDLSYKSCIYCDYLTGPFVMKRQLFLNLIDKSMNDETAFVDLFATMSERLQPVMSCPDVMIVIADRELSVLPKTDWIPFVKKWQLNRIIFSNNKDLSFTCFESNSKCTTIGGVIKPICCFRELLDIMKFTVEIFARYNIDLELEGGSNVGAAKTYGIMPYELDADFDFDIRHHKTFAGLASEYEKRGYEIVEDKIDYKCVNSSAINCGYFRVKNDNWYIEMWGVNTLGSNEAHRLGLKRKTVIRVDGIWMTSYYSPAESARNQYGDDVYQYIEHWRSLGLKTGWVQPKTGNWLPCPKPGFHGCLTNYVPVGDVQFQDVWI